MPAQAGQAGLAKSAEEPYTIIGDEAEFSIELDIPAKVNLYDATVLDALPPGIKAGTIARVSTVWEYTDETPGTPGGPVGEALEGLDADGHEYGWFFGTIPSSDTPRKVTLTYTGQIDPDESSDNRPNTVLTNSARLKWNFDEKFPSGTPELSTTFDDETPIDTATVRARGPVLSIEKDVSGAASKKPGETFTYTVTVTNGTGNHVSDAHDVAVLDAVPAGVKVLGGTISHQGELTKVGVHSGGGEISWTGLGPIEPGDSIELTYQAQLTSPAYPGSQVNQATITAVNSLPDGAGMDLAPSTVASATVTPLLPSVELTKAVVDGVPAYRGEPVIWRLTVKSTTSAPAHDVHVEDTLPASWTYVEGSAQVSYAGADAIQIEPVVTGQVLTWDFSGDDFADGLAQNETVVIDFEAVPGEDAPVGGSTVHRNNAEVTFTDLDGGSELDPRTAHADTRIDSADLGITKTAPEARPVAGAEYTWTVTVHNDGPDTAREIVVTDTLPAGVTYERFASDDDVDCALSPTDPQKLVCEVDDLATNTSVTFTVTGTVDDSLTEGTSLLNTGGRHGSHP